MRHSGRIARGPRRSAPLNPSLIPVWQAENQPQPGGSEQEKLLNGAFPAPQPGGKQKEKTTPDDKSKNRKGTPPKKPKAKEVATMSKAFGLPIYYIET
jgi:hypothetical protein